MQRRLARCGSLRSSDGGYASRLFRCGICVQAVDAVHGVDVVSNVMVPARDAMWCSAHAVSMGGMSVWHRVGVWWCDVRVCVSMCGVCVCSVCGVCGVTLLVGQVVCVLLPAVRHMVDLVYVLQLVAKLVCAQLPSLHVKL